MRKGKIIIDYESDDLGRCSFNICQESEENLNNENIINLLEHIIRELMPEDIKFQ